MKKKTKREHPVFNCENPVFKKGDIISSLSKDDIRLIMGVKDGEYEFIHLNEQRFQDIANNWHTIEKGSQSSQPVGLVHKYFCIVDLSKL